MPRNNIKANILVEKPSVIELLRKKAGLTQVELAEKIGVARTTVCRWESNDEKVRSEPKLSIEEWINLSHAVNIHYFELINYFAPSYRLDVVKIN